MSIQYFDAGPRLSQCVVHGGTIYLAGLVADDYSGGVAAQAQQILAKVDAYLAKAGSDRSRLLQCHIWLTDMAFYDDFNKVWDAWVAPGRPPARACLRTELARPEWLVEVMCIAAGPASP